MVNFLARLFIKDYKNVENEKVRTGYGTMCGIFGIITNIILVAMKLTIGILTGSIAIIADAINNLSDCGSSIVTIIGFKISSKPADKDHPYGHQRVEYIIGLIIGMIIMFVGVELLKTSIEKIITPEPVSSSYITYIILGVSILLKLLQGMFYLSASKKINSISLKASGKDSFNDTISTTVVLIGLIVSPYIGYNLDGVLGLLVSAFIIYSSIGILKDATSPLIGEKPDKELINKICEDVMSFDGIYGIHDVVAHTYGPSKIFISLHAEVDSSTHINLNHDIVDNAEFFIKNKYGIEITMHMDPIDMHDENRNEKLVIVKEILEEIDPTIKFHDFRMVVGPSHTNLIFDVLVPHQYKLSDEELVKLIQEKVLEKAENHFCVINVDKDYIN